MGMNGNLIMLLDTAWLTRLTGQQRGFRLWKEAALPPPPLAAHPFSQPQHCPAGTGMLCTLCSQGAEKSPFLLSPRRD